MEWPATCPYRLESPPSIHTPKTLLASTCVSFSFPSSAHILTGAISLASEEDVPHAVIRIRVRIRYRGSRCRLLLLLLLQA